MIHGERKRELAISDAQTPEIRALINEYGFRVIMTALASCNTNDPESIRQFAETNRRMTQEALARG